MSLSSVVCIDLFSHLSDSYLSDLRTLFLSCLSRATESLEQISVSLSLSLLTYLINLLELDLLSICLFEQLSIGNNKKRRRKQMNE